MLLDITGMKRFFEIKIGRGCFVSIHGSVSK